MKLSVVILNYNVRYFLELCLKSVEAAIKNIEAEIIVVDNNSTDDSSDMVRQLFPKVKLIQNEDNYGFSKGNNIGVKRAKGEYLCILNPDTVVAEDTFERLLKFAESQTGLGIIGCQLIDGKGQFLPESKRNIPTPKVAFQKLLGNTKNYYVNTLFPDDVGKVDILVGAFMLLKRSIYNEVNGFDEDYFMYGEDVDLSYKILKAGYNNHYYGKVAIIHFKGESTIRNRIHLKRFYGAMEIFYKKHFKSNFLMTFLVKSGVRLGAMFRRKAKVIVAQSSHSIVVSDSDCKELKTRLKNPVSVSFNLNTIPNDSLVVFDTNYLNFSTIIEFMKQNNAIPRNSYRIWPKNSTFILGSDSNTSRGDVLHF